VWGLSTGLLIKVLVDGTISNILPYCWVGTRNEMESYSIIPVGIFVFSTVILVVSVMTKLSILSRKTTGTVFSLEVVSSYIRPLLFLLIIIFIYE